jgi:hypothetical protein
LYSIASCIEFQVWCLLLRDKGDANQLKHKGFDKDPLHFQAIFNREHDAAAAFLPRPGQSLAKGLFFVTNYVTNVIFLHLGRS